MVRKNKFSIAALFKLVVPAQASVGQPIRADWVFGRGALDSMRKLNPMLSDVSRSSKKMMAITRPSGGYEAFVVFFFSLSSTSVVLFLPYFHHTLHLFNIV